MDLPALSGVPKILKILLCKPISRLFFNFYTDMRIVAGTAGTPAEPSSHRVRNQNEKILRVVDAKLSL